MYRLSLLMPVLVLIASMPAPARSPGDGTQAPALSCEAAPVDELGPPAEPSSGPAPLHIRAPAFDAPPDAPARLYGGVRLERGDQRLETEELLYDRASGRITLPVWLRYQDAWIHVEAERGWYRVEPRAGRFESVVYRLPAADGSGRAATIELTSPGQAEVSDFDFTTCDPDDPAWQLRSAEVRLDMEAGRGTARHARLEFGGVPVFYSPWMSFPLTDERQTGFLYPRLGYSTDDGFDVSVPWYWNIAPNQDATLAPRWIEKRGAMLETQYRFLTARQRGELNLDVLPDDRIANRHRYYGEFDWRARLAPRWSASARLRRASDDDYFVDMGSDLYDSAVQFLRSSAAVRGRGDFWSLEVLADDFQVLDEAVGPQREPYRRLPRVTLQVDRPLAGGLEWSLTSELVYFDRDEGVSGARLDLMPALGYNLIRPGWFLRPRLAWRSTVYNLDDADDDRVSRNLPIASVDAGLVFERRLDSGRLQTLEPRLYYLYAPGRDQDDLPVFDTRELTFGFSQLFHFNRFSGADRQAAANQLTAALTSRLIDGADGASLLDLAVGQTFYFRDQAVQLPDAEATDHARSATVAELTWRPARMLALNAGLQWDAAEDETDAAHLGLSYRTDNGFRAAAGYRFRRDRVDQADLRFRYPFSDRLNLIGRVTYSFEEDETLEVLGGVEYESCCWAVRVTAREYIRDRHADKRTAFFVELHLKGLGSLGRRPYPLFNDRS